MPSRTYKGIAVVQQDGSPTFYLASAPAKELLEWCDVPRAKGDYMAGYQRVLDLKRSNAVTTYMALSPANVIPGAIIIAVDQDYITVASKDGVSEVTIRDDVRTFDDKLQEHFGALSSRLSNEELNSAGIEFSAEDWEEDDDEPEGEHPSSYVAALCKELNTALTDWAALPEERQRAITEYIEGASKPGLIIDGQHRVFGAAALGKDALLPVVLLPGLAHAEQVFQFYVLNSKAKPLTASELRRIVSTSLTNQDIEELYKRFKQAGVNADEARWTLEMDTRPDSPFRSRIDFGYGKQGALIKENVADQIVRAFMMMPRKYRPLTVPLGDQWIDVETRLSIFFWFWKAIKQQYAEAWAQAEADAEKGRLNQLFYKVALLTLQRFVLDHFLTGLSYRPGQPPPFSTEEEVGKMVAFTLQTLPADFFAKEWKTKQIDTKPGREELYKTMETVWNSQGKIHGNMKLFKG